MQFIPAVIYCALIGFFPERQAKSTFPEFWWKSPLLTRAISPRWLIENDRADDAAGSLAKLRGTTRMEDLQAELDEIRANIEWHNQHSVKSVKILFVNKALRARLWRAWLLNFLQQMSGASGIRYYLPTNFLAAGTSKSFSLLASGLDGTVQVVCTVIGLILIDRIGRRHALGFGAAVTAFSLMASFSCS
jgi:hypothetical protein